jgi:hypothetical protein
MKTSPTSLKIRQVIIQMRDGDLIPRPEFQRKLVWTTEDKVRFIDTILKGYPFPEIYLANGDTNVDTGAGTQLLVDGQQRLTTIVSYFNGDDAFVNTPIPQYSDLQKTEKEGFLNYDVAARDLGPISAEEIVEVFRRINSTKYSLNEIEINNAVYAGELMRLAAGIAEHEFFDAHKVFRATDIKRMGDVRFVLQLIITMMGGYFNRDELLEDYLKRFNDSFPSRDEIAARLIKIFSFIDECEFHPRSRFWKRSDLFTAIIELDMLSQSGVLLNVSDVYQRLEDFYVRVDKGHIDDRSIAVRTYAKASIQASNDRLNRIRRGVIIGAILNSSEPDAALIDLGLVDQD